MAWEQRGNNRYYYRKRWEDGRCVSVYRGTGETADLVATCEQFRRAEEAQAREDERARRAEIESSDQSIDALVDLMRTLTHAVLVTNGYHQHKGQWRRRRAHRD